MAKRRFAQPEDLRAAWEEFKAECDNQTALTHVFSSKKEDFISKDLKKAITYTIEGFCVYAGISRRNYYRHYAKNARFAEITQMMREECEVDARGKFELGLIPTQLSGLWMSHYGYSTKPNEGNLQESLEKIDALTRSITELSKKDGT